MTQSLSESMPAMGGLARLLPQKKALSTTTTLFQAFPTPGWVWARVAWHGSAWISMASRPGLTQWEVPSQDAAVCAGWRLFQAEDGGSAPNEVAASSGVSPRCEI